MCNEKVVRSVVPKLIKELDTCRIKDVSICLLANATFDFKISPLDADA